MNSTLKNSDVSSQLFPRLAGEEDAEAQENRLLYPRAADPTAAYRLMTRFGTAYTDRWQKKPSSDDIQSLANYLCTSKFVSDDSAFEAALANIPESIPEFMAVHAGVDGMMMLIADRDEKRKQEEAIDELERSLFGEWGIKSLGELEAADLKRPEAIIDGLLSRGEVLGFVGSTKTWKTWLTIGLAVAVASGTSYAGFRASAPRKVRIFDTELGEFWWKERVMQVCHALRVDQAMVNRNLRVTLLRGKSVDIKQIRDKIGQMPKGEFGLVILDALYMLLPKGVEENSNDAMTNVMQEAIGIAADSDAGVIVVRHATKGNQSDRDVIDVGSGAGSGARAVDTHAVIRRHKEEGAVVLESVFRNLKPRPPVCLRFNHPVFEVALDLDPAELHKTSRGGDEQKPKAAVDTCEFCQRFLTFELQTLSDIKAKCSGTLAVNSVNPMLKKAVRDGYAEEGTVGKAQAYKRAVPFS